LALNLSKTVTDYLKQRAEQKFTARQIAQWVVDTYPAECQEKMAKSNAITTDVDLKQQLVREIGSQRPQLQKKQPQIKTTEGRPRQYYWSDKSDQVEVSEAESEEESEAAVKAGVVIPLKEHDLYPLLSKYLCGEFNVYSKRIDEKRSSNKQGAQGNKWLFPDLVGMENLAEDWHPYIKACVKEYADKKTKLWSFEVKLLLNRANVRSAFFQAVSNSSWANFGYLVAGEIEGAATMKELRMLSGLHGIGFIQLDAENPAESQILIPARERPEIDWASCNRLASENADFQEFVSLVCQFYQTGKAKLADWDVPKEP
jgi:hypothetical protein